MPFFSILIPSYNRPEYLSVAIASVLASDFPDFELIVSDNSSPRQAEIKQVLESSMADPRLKLVLQSENLGEARNRHFLMQEARGDYRIIMGDDDLLVQHALSELRSAIRKSPGFDLYLFGYSVIDGDGRIFETRRALRPFEISGGKNYVMKDLLCADLHPFWFYHPATFCFPASLHRDVHPNHNVGIGDDVMFLFDAMFLGKRCFVLPSVLFSYRKSMKAAAYKTQPNLSRGRLANVTSRCLIFSFLLSRSDLPAWAGDFVHSREFRERFLFDSIVDDPDAEKEQLGELGLDSEHLSELRTYWEKYRSGWFHSYLQVTRIRRFARYFGIARGLYESWRIAQQRRNYRRKTGTLAH